jgi:hypothetical protein
MTDPAEVEMGRTLDGLIEALAGLDQADVSKATSVRIPEALHRAVLLATELGMDESFTAATTRALADRLFDFVRRRALAEHFSRFPADLPTLATVAHRRVQGSDHPAVSHPELVEAAATWVEQRRPDWALTGAADETVDEVLGYVEMLAAGVGTRRGRRSA